MHAVEQAVAEQLLRPAAEQRLGRRRDEPHRAVAAMAGDDVGHVAREQAIAVLLGVRAARSSCARAIRAEREAGGIERGGDDAERRQRRPTARPDAARRAPSGRRTGTPAAPSAKVEADATTRREADKRGFERHDHQPDRGERGDAAGLGGDRGDEAGQRQRREHMRALVVAGARQVIGDQDRRDEPGEHDDFERARHAAQGEIDRQRGERQQAAEQPRRDERAVARGRQRVVLRRRMHQRVDHTRGSARTGPRHSSTPDVADALPLLSADRVRGHLSER